MWILRLKGSWPGSLEWTSPRVSNPMDNKIAVPCPEIMGNYLSVTIFRFRENSWEPTFISVNVHAETFFLKHVFKHTFKLKNISAHYYLQKKLHCLLKCEKVNLSVKCACTKVWKTADCLRSN